MNDSIQILKEMLLQPSIDIEKSSGNERGLISLNSKGFTLTLKGQSHKFIIKKGYCVVLKEKN